jgi:hypothetical protein
LVKKAHSFRLFVGWRRRRRHGHHATLALLTLASVAVGLGNQEGNQLRTAHNDAKRHCPPEGTQVTKEDFDCTMAEQRKKSSFSRSQQSPI